ncbi:isoprenylcysteine carboxylmethyltransferase family protein [Phormidesmis priestleyi ULC007]|uniref:Isoprenylcysteine carboxylmethyltransferase family protein n=1 Tax=Phormidesmis priestleyi ULC007 TaxID=1920490 RepID=A0A2T1DEL7_9CYAN|nr:isoprenylcysteine carboxylmethyltransferase family protein [Phormidesmis priestleyi]PSB18939.1 isoprenylcysteine carboxylmethyltransferase family protein [Phormidesmis priestleyi ULC007]PZO53927.1 MAG: isoprenylcysteine carboxylmethyltransferase family protein [Phormidesmis priestleyi]
MSEETVDNPGVIAFPPALFAGTLAIGLLLHFIFPATFLPQWIAIASGVVLLVGAALIAISAFRAMRRAQTAVDPSCPTTAIVSDGAFSFSRNPIYLSLTMLYVGIALLFNAFWALLLLLPLIVVVQNGVIKREEHYLEQKFGDEYLRYKASVRRWV